MLARARLPTSIQRCASSELAGLRSGPIDAQAEPKLTLKKIKLKKAYQNWDCDDLVFSAV
jgi:hypothetical protein